MKGLHYHLEGGEGVCLIENISKLSDSEGEKDDDDKWRKNKKLDFCLREREREKGRNYKFTLD